MKILVFGAKGRTGKHLIDQLTDHQVTKYEGDILDRLKVLQAMNDIDVVVSVIGHGRGTQPNMQTIGITNVVEAMKQNKISRIISLTGTGVRMPGDKITLLDRLLNLGIRIIDPARVKDGADHVRVLEASGLDWTVVRVLKLTNTKSNSNWTLSLNGPAKLFISRADVAKAIISILQDKSYSQKTPIISLK
jgi:putative NADH-flavin reductase